MYWGFFVRGRECRCCPHTWTPLHYTEHKNGKPVFSPFHLALCSFGCQPMQPIFEQYLHVKLDILVILRYFCIWASTQDITYRHGLDFFGSTQGHITVFLCFFPLTKTILVWASKFFSDMFCIRDYTAKSPVSRNITCDLFGKVQQLFSYVSGQICEPRF